MAHICQTRLAKELEKLALIESKSLKINFSTDHKNLELNLSVKSFPVTYYITLPENYPFLPPVITSNISPELSQVYCKTSNLLDLILDDSWTPAISLQVLVEKLILFNSQTLTASKFHPFGGLSIWTILLIGITFRVALFSQSYSGHYTAPLYGDYEAQRHWMEITVNYPVEDWYKAEPEYWKLDYPPLTAWHSYLCGIFSSLIEPPSVELGKSRGYYTDTHLVFMRMTVLIGEYLVYIPALLMFFEREKINEKLKNTAFMVFLIIPGFVLIDYGHFQYNNMMIGFALASILFTLNRQFELASAALALSFNFKIMGLYYSLPLISYWLASVYDHSLRSRSLYGRDLETLTRGFLSVGGLLTIGGTGVLICCLLWSPWLSLEEGKHVLSRIFPIDRGVFEDKVATFWCISSVLIKYKQLFSVQMMSVITGITTLSLSGPFIYLTVAKREIRNSLLFGVAGVSLTFFLFSYHVHEKTILVPLMPIGLVTIFSYPDIFELFVVTSTFSLYPLLVLDRLKIAYFAFQLVFFCFSFIHKKNLAGLVNLRRFWGWYLGMGFVHGLEGVSVFPSYPYFFELVVAGYSFIGFGYVWWFLLLEFYSLKKGSSILSRVKKDKTG